MRVGVEGALSHLQQLLSSSSCPVHFYCPVEYLSRATKLANPCSLVGLWEALGLVTLPGTCQWPGAAWSGAAQFGSILCKKKQFMANTQIVPCRA